jgi:hypothetical protein
MQRKTRSLRLFTKKQTNTETAMPSLPSTVDTRSSRLYRSIAQLPLNKFIDVVVDSNLYALVISGSPSVVDLEQAWAEVKGEYLDAVGDHESKLYWSLFREINILTITLNQIKLLVEMLEQVYYPPFAEKLNRLLHTAFAFDPNNEEEYIRLLKGCINRSKAYKIDLDLKTIHMQSIDEKRQSGGSYSREYFQSVLITISDHAKYPVSDTISVYEFCERMRRYNHYCEQMNKRNK